MPLEWPHMRGSSRSGQGQLRVIFLEAAWLFGAARSSAGWLIAFAVAMALMSRFWIGMDVLVASSATSTQVKTPQSHDCRCQSCCVRASMLHQRPTRGFASHNQLFGT